MIWNLVLKFLILKWNFLHYFCAISALFQRFPRYFYDFRGRERSFPAFEIAFFHFKYRKTNFKTAEIAVIAEITRKLCGKFHFRIRKYSTKFHIKVRKPHFKLRKVLFKKGLGKKLQKQNCHRI